MKRLRNLTLSLFFAGLALAACDKTSSTDSSTALNAEENVKAKVVSSAGVEFPPSPADALKADRKQRTTADLSAFPPGASN